MKKIIITTAGILVFMLLNDRAMAFCCIPASGSSSRIGGQSQNENTTLATFPNPASSSVTTSLLLNNSQHILIQLSDVNGRIVSTLTDQNYDAGRYKVEWNVSDLNAGVYSLHVRSNELLKIEKLIIAK